MDASGHLRLSLFLFIITVCLMACGGEDKKPDQPVKPVEKPIVTKIKTPMFNQDSAYHYVDSQVKFGPRVPNSEPHRKCALWLESKLKSFGLEVIVQKGEVMAYNGVKLKIKNIIGRYRPELKDRIMLFAHWDTRPYADRGNERKMEPIAGANDGASGVGVLLELARTISADSLKPNVGYDIIFFDAEDYGQPEDAMMERKDDTWCLGTQYWAKNPPIKNYKPRFGILLDMVGAPSAYFPKEATSVSYAPEIVEKVWTMAASLGYGNYFINDIIQFVGSDDHVYVNELAGIPAIDIIQYDPATRGFGAYHHTHDDDMKNIDPNTLNAVGHTLLGVLYAEKPAQVQ